ncbi:unnamed protein product [Larinioides sclopetarius]|uniref:Uncharacterized protein n=1 Tax=Larinioides sclopetarius TaxID=280406 RepID=A0AAV2AE91_9ARAC
MPRENNYHEQLLEETLNGSSPTDESSEDAIVEEQTPRKNYSQEEVEDIDNDIKAFITVMKLAPSDSLFATDTEKALNSGLEEDERGSSSGTKKAVREDKGNKRRVSFADEGPRKKAKVSCGMNELEDPEKPSCSSSITPAANEISSDEDCIYYDIDDDDFPFMNMEEIPLGFMPQHSMLNEEPASLPDEQLIAAEDNDNVGISNTYEELRFSEEKVDLQDSATGTEFMLFDEVVSGGLGSGCDPD